MANVNFNVEFSTFVNWYFGIGNADEITPDLLTDCGFDDDYFDFSVMSGIGVNDCKSLCKFFTDNYKSTVHVEMIPDEFNELAKITTPNGATFTVQCDEIDVLLAQNETERKRVATYKNKEIFACNVLGRVLYCTALFNEYPDYFTYFGTLDDVKNRIDWRTRNDR